MAKKQTFPEVMEEASRKDCITCTLPGEGSVTIYINGQPVSTPCGVEVEVEPHVYNVLKGANLV